MQDYIVHKNRQSPPLKHKKYSHIVDAENRQHEAFITILSNPFSIDTFFCKRRALAVLPPVRYRSRLNDLSVISIALRCNSGMVL